MPRATRRRWPALFVVSYPSYQLAWSPKRTITQLLSSQVTTDAIVHAITSSHPQVRVARKAVLVQRCPMPRLSRLHTHILLQVRYVVANVDGTPAWVLIWVKWLMPERAWDALVLAMW